MDQVCRHDLDGHYIVCLLEMDKVIWFTRLDGHRVTFLIFSIVISFSCHECTCTCPSFLKRDSLCSSDSVANYGLHSCIVEVNLVLSVIC